MKFIDLLIEIDSPEKVLPTIVIMPARTQTVAGGETATFRCVVKAGNPPPAVVWKREESETLNSTNDGLLVISHATGDSQGKYICEAKNALGSTEAVALLVVQGKENTSDISGNPQNNEISNNFLFFHLLGLLIITEYMWIT